jgi:CBS domain containing-hemolysin-like protein
VRSPAGKWGDEVERPKVVLTVLCAVFGALGCLFLVVSVLTWNLLPFALFIAFAAGFVIVCALIGVANIVVFGPVLWVLASIVALFERKPSVKAKIDRGCGS